MRKVSQPDDKRLMVGERISQTMERDEFQRSGRDEAVRRRVFIKKKGREAPLSSQISMTEPPRRTDLAWGVSHRETGHGFLQHEV